MSKERPTKVQYNNEGAGGGAGVIIGVIIAAIAGTALFLAVKPSQTVIVQSGSTDSSTVVQSGDATVTKPADTPVDKPADTPGDNPADTSGDKPADTPGDKPADTPADSADAVGPDVNSPGEGLVEMKVELPRPVFAGTPKTIPPGVRIDKKAYGKPRGRFFIPEGSNVISREKSVESSDNAPIIGDIDLINDGDKEAIDGSWVELEGGVQHVTLDLGAPHKLDAVLIWHYHGEARFYHDVIVQVADDKDFTKNVRTIFNNDHDNSAGLGTGEDYEYVEAKEGKLVDPKGAVAQFVRLYSNGSTADDQNHYTEVEVWGRPAEEKSQ